MSADPSLVSRFYSLICRASTELPVDVVAALQQASFQAEATEKASLDTMLANANLATSCRRPICQDTGTLLFYLKAPAGVSHRNIEVAVREATVQATAAGILRQNCVESVTGKNTGNNLGEGSPVFHWEEWDAPELEITLLLKGGGSENQGTQYSLPDARLKADRSLEGVRRCVLDAVFQAQGKGCAPGILGVCIGGDRATGYEESKRQLLRKIGERSQTPELAALEKQLLKEANSLGIGAMGIGGKSTLLEVFIGARCRLPASFFVSISYMCWCCRRQTMHIPLAEIR